ncbi:hypothetical protein [uncultured Gammaproteobacteria bacterium]|nr:hypothetical protein [uncultured Gammaproteobacteria bacterium]CAC9630277.1 hypothetical protein [uncultured Gammaproteobacteria bacterium]CAC9633480.1 hypothetical protein [uncultured Gammaproteobacteria bacterium]CAC9649769.1 hypothetical protein [uncultured Gammaproteobacteria bacterium]
MTIQTEIINLEDLVPTNHLYRKFTKLIDLDKITNKHLTTIVGNSNYKGYGINTLSGFTTLSPTFKNHTPKQIRLQIIPIL